MKKERFEIFHCVVSGKQETLGNVIKFMGWGSNRNVREKGFRVDQNFKKECPYFSKRLKEIPLVKDPSFLLDNYDGVLTPKGKEALVFRIEQG
jgi:hypothetical protein